MTSLAPPAGAPWHHGRRRKPEDSVSLRQSRSASRSKNDDSSSSFRSGSLLQHQPSSGETNSPDSWFEKRNHNVAQNRPFLKQNETPFYIPNQDDSVDSAPMQNDNLSLPVRTAAPALPALASHGSSTEEYRSVIDDLTVQNQRLRKRLQKFERKHDSHLEAEKLFEVKIHGLSPSKKRELEETLRKFASSLQNSPPRSDQTTLSSGPVKVLPVSKAADKSDTSGQSSVKWTDSGYGSMAASKSRSNVTDSKGTSKSQFTPASSSGQIEASHNDHANIRTYLHDIPEGLLPKHNPVMTEKAKKKLVVQRLEQIFNGRGAVPGLHQQSQQQQEVSQTAANDERIALDLMGQAAPQEGVREAKIMTKEFDDRVISKSSNAAEQTVSDSSKHVEDSGTSDNKSPSPEQRPTRPLDLDPDRAQVPSDNIHYIQHLGFLHHAAEQTTSPNSEQDWVYLNLLIGMAQLHTLNVTIEFVQRAVADYSYRFELSKDGRKVRWKGSNGVSDASYEDMSMSPAQAYDNPRKRQFPADAAQAPTQMAKRVARGDLQQGGKWTYQPIFAHKRSSTDSDYSMFDSPTCISSPMPGNVSRESARVSSRKSKDDGPIIFYSKATFCVDYSGDVRPASNMHNTINYNPFTSTPLGEAPISDPIWEARRSDELQQLSTPPTSKELLDADLLNVDFPSPRTSPRHVTFAEPEESLSLDASGVGGVVPFDNFVITTIRQRNSLVSGPSSCEKSGGILTKFACLNDWQNFKVHPLIRDRVVSQEITNLEPSPLPPALLDFNSSSDCDSDSDMLDVSSSSGSRAPTGSEAVDMPGSHTQDSAVSKPNAFWRAHAISAGSRTYANGRNGIDGDDQAEDAASISSTAAQKFSPHPAVQPSPRSEASSGSDRSGVVVDFLAQVRLEHPDLIRAQEREYDAEMAERLAEEIPAGSSAATAGGGSGFGTPVAGENSDADAESCDGGGSGGNQDGHGDDVMSLASGIKS